MPPSLSRRVGNKPVNDFSKFERDYNRFEQVFHETDICPLGSGALVGNNYNIDREFLAKELGFSSLTQNSLDAVSDRDFLLSFCAAASNIVVDSVRAAVNKAPTV